MEMKTSRLLRRVYLRVNQEAGAVATEYGLLLVLIALVIVVAATAYGLEVSGLFDRGTAGFPGGGGS